MLRVNQLTGFGGGRIDLTLANSSSGSNASTTSHTINLPSGISSGDILVMVFSRNGTGNSITLPAFFTTTILNNSEVAIAYRRCDGSEGSTTTVTTSIADPSNYVVALVRGFPTASSPTVSTQATASSTSPNASSVSSTYGFYIVAAGARSSASWTASPTGYTMIAQLGSGGSAAMGWKKTGIAGSDDPSAWTLSTSATWYAYTIGF